MATRTGEVAAAARRSDTVADMGGEAAAGSGGQIVVVRQEVADTIGHVLGNVFQRLYHLIDRAAAAAPAEAADLLRQVQRLEDFLRLVMDYVSPEPLVLEHVPATEVAQSLARQLSDAVGCAVRLDARLPVEGRLLVDPGRLGRAFRLLAGRLEGPAAPGGVTLGVKATARAAGQALQLRACLPPQVAVRRSSEADIAWAVAERLVELHGGGLAQHLQPDGGTTWEISLPLQP